MALKKCKECGHEVSNRAKKCPNCGAPIGTGCSTGCLIFILVIFLMGSLGSLFSGKDSTMPKKNWKEQDNSTMAYIQMEDFVKQRLKSPKSANFPGVLDGRADHVKYLGNQIYSINSYVDAKNLFGVTIRNSFFGEIEQISQYHWRLISLELTHR